MTEVPGLHGQGLKKGYSLHQRLKMPLNRCLGLYMVHRANCFHGTGWAHASLANIHTPGLCPATLPLCEPWPFPANLSAAFSEHFARDWMYKLTARFPKQCRVARPIQCTRTFAPELFGDWIWRLLSDDPLVAALDVILQPVCFLVVLSLDRHHLHRDVPQSIDSTKYTFSSWQQIALGHA